ncbi:D-alanyl-D-alanine carboxypeptidase/D-alanyl-D-alanine-endopeptidase (penicillin-binding protein 4) [Palleronia aestuarii]|uniref:D-alanyl-D-alanine carboxypeptidase/D-alanyl-D-alanine-endopeptidase (Penicillin-binding protein 4) n=1 Tax=Palleronia aestuarii TaxID=568105 RepID=A0A2W7N586_9RHOB|nr:D-alanyl-D-alanine carboxypeptidase/D-alanyl-D-alanine-endopeptidase [Palleronia aestuarii]PZX15198.1 D-alanyl-D-alanine carboxypeptidase/D-alanyl-D-alanine-endopeptidase (penicillin-binding protein 4) [Palleronia aestuarii]
MRLTRRTVLAGLASAGSTAAWAEAPLGSLRPRPRAGDFAIRTVPGGAAMVARSQLSGRVGFAVADAETGQILESYNPEVRLPPASTAKALTSLYALDRLGPEHRFETRLLATAPIEDGRIDGDLILAGGGDPTLDTDDLAQMASDLKDRGVREVTGGLRIWGGALPQAEEIDPEQPDHVGYNPSVGGLNLNYNRVYFEWERQGETYRVAMQGRSASRRPGVTMAQMEVVDRRTPVFSYAYEEERESWSVARWALGSEGARWLPVRHPDTYTGEVFEVLARSEGIEIAGGTTPVQSVEGEVLVRHHSAPLTTILRDMLKFSTNLTAEAVGLSASSVSGPVAGFSASGARMSNWLRSDLQLADPQLIDHSGLGDDSRISAQDMVRAMVVAGSDGLLSGLLKPYPVADRPGLDVAAKTGTLNFVSALTGFIGGQGRPPLAFAILCADIERRDSLAMEEREQPPGGQVWLNRARTLQRGLLARWGTVYTG